MIDCFLLTVAPAIGVAKSLDLRERSFYDDGMTWRELDPDEQWRYRKAEAPPAGKEWGYSPAKVLVEVDIDSLEYELVKGRRDLFKVAELLCEPHRLHPCALADAYVTYGTAAKLLPVLERSEEAIAYVLALPEPEDTRGIDTKAHVRSGKDMARSICARRAALEALK